MAATTQTVPMGKTFDGRLLKRGRAIPKKHVTKKKGS